MIRPRKHDGAGDDQRHADRNAAIEIFAKNEPRNQCGQYGFGVQQQRRVRCRQTRQSPHQQHRTDDPAEYDRTGEPAPFAGLQASAHRTSNDAHEKESDTRSEIQQPGEQPWADRPQKQLRRRGAGAEERCRTQRSDNSRAARAIHRLGICEIVPSPVCPTDEPALMCREPFVKGNWRPQPDSNRCRRRERAVS